MSKPDNLRDEIALRVLAVMLDDQPGPLYDVTPETDLLAGAIDLESDEVWAQRLAGRAYRLADEMLKARDG